MTERWVGGWRFLIKVSTRRISHNISGASERLLVFSRRNKLSRRQHNLRPTANSRHFKLNPCSARAKPKLRSALTPAFVHLPVRARIDLLSEIENKLSHRRE